MASGSFGGMGYSGGSMSYGQAMAEIGQIRMKFDGVINVAQQMKAKAAELLNAGENLRKAKDRVCGSEWIGADAEAFSNKVNGLVGDAGRPGSVLYHAEALKRAGEALEKAAMETRTKQTEQVRRMANI